MLRDVSRRQFLEGPTAGSLFAALSCGIGPLRYGLPKLSVAALAFASDSAG
jgi:hypothetical protein